jgi:hypothetical protein
MTRRSTLLSGAAVAAALALLTLPQPVRAHEDGEGSEHLRLAGTWNVTLRFPTCSALCSCPGGVPNIPIPALHSYVPHGALTEVGGGSNFRGPALGSWQRVGHHSYRARYKFFIFNPDGTRRASEEITSDIDVTTPDAFEATAAFDLFDSAGTLIVHGCPIHATATRFE